jgi:hypothetical protein
MSGKKHELPGPGAFAGEAVALPVKISGSANNGAAAP